MFFLEKDMFPNTTSLFFGSNELEDNCWVI